MQSARRAFTVRAERSQPPMRIFVPKETLPGETRVPLVPATAARLVKLGAEVEAQADLGATIRCPDADYR